MKVIVNTKTSIPKVKKEGVVVETMMFSDLIDAVISIPLREGGFNISEQKVRLKIMGITEEAKKETTKMSFEDADFNIILQSAKVMKWSLLHKDIVAFTDVITNCE